MCFLILATVMSYCLRKASTGSCMMEICILSFLVILPMMAMLMALYLLLPFFTEVEDVDVEGKKAIKDCDKPRLLGLLQRVYPDSNQLMFKCNMLNFGDNLGVVLTECFEKGEPDKGEHFVSSRSAYWNKDNHIHKILNFNTIEEDQGNITIMEVTPPLPEPCATTEDNNLEGEDNYFYVEHEFHPELEHILVGWRYHSKMAETTFEEKSVIDKCKPGYRSAIVFTRVGRYFSGFQSGQCDENDTFIESLIPYSVFLKKIHEIYPNVEFKAHPSQLHPNKEQQPPDEETVTKKKPELKRAKGMKLRSFPGRVETEITKTNKKNKITETNLAMPNVYKAKQLDKDTDILNALTNATLKHSSNMGINLDFKDNVGHPGSGIQRSQFRNVDGTNNYPSNNNLKFCVDQFSHKASCSNSKFVIPCCLQFNISGCVLKVLRVCGVCYDSSDLDESCKEFIDLVMGKKYFPNRLFTEVATTAGWPTLATKTRYVLVRENKGIDAYKRSDNTEIFDIP